MQRSFKTAMRLLLLGPQGAGKGTQAQQLARLTGALHLSTGDLIRAEITANTELGRSVKDYNDRGELVPDDIIIAMILPRITAAESWILDGFPRNPAQAAALDCALTRVGVELDAVVALEAPDAELIARLSERRQSQSSGKIYHMVNNPPAADDPGPFVQRDDDQPRHIRRRLEIYHAETEPLTTYYAAKDLLVRIDALGPIDGVTGTILHTVEERTAAWPYQRKPLSIKRPPRTAEPALRAVSA